MKFTVIAIMMSLTGLTAFAQIRIEGEVQNRQTGEMLSDTHILISGTTIGIVSNLDGKFALDVTELPVTLNVGYIGYESAEIEVLDAGNAVVIRLVPANESLAGIMVTDDYEINLIEQAVEKLLQSRSDKIFGKAFYRQLTTQQDTVYSEFIETFYEAELSPNEIERWKITNGRYALLKGESTGAIMTMPMTNFSSFSNVGLASSTTSAKADVIWPLRKDARKYYDYYLEKKYNSDDGDILVFRFDKKKGIKIPGFEGTLTLVEGSRDIIEMDAHVADKRFTPARTNIKRAKEINQVFSIKFTRQKMDNGSYYPGMIKVALSYELAAKPLLLMIKRTFEHPHKFKTESALFFYEYDTSIPAAGLGDEYFKERDEQGTDYTLIDEVHYNPQFWRENPIIKRTPVEEKVIESFEKYESFGKMFNEKEKEAKPSGYNR